MRMLLVVWGLVVAALTAQVAAQQFDMAAIQKWGQAKVVHYQIVGAYHAMTPVAPGNPGQYAQVDVMPTDESVLGFSNRWYPMAIDTAQRLDIAGYEVRVVTPALFVATKLEAFHGLGATTFSRATISRTS